MSTKYSGKNIKTFDHDVDKIRMRPTQYLGEEGDHMVLTMAREPFDNCVDEHLAKRNDAIHIVFDPPARQITVIDEGHGIPTEMRKVQGKKISTLTAVFTQLQAGGKFDDAAYEKSRGTHGVGVTATNALSEKLQVWSAYKGKLVTQKFVKGHPVTDLVRAKPPVFGSGKHTIKMKPKGTAVSFVPDPSVVGKKAKLVIGDLLKMVDQTAYLNPKLKITVTVVGKGTKVFHHKGGVADYLKHTIQKLKCGTLGKPCIINHKDFDVAFQFSDYDGDGAFVGYTNSLPNVDGGVHIDVFRNELFKVLQAKAGARAKEFKERDLREGLVGLVDWKLSGPKFSSQTKEKLVDTRVKDHAKTLHDAIKKFFDQNKSLAKQIIARAGELAALKEEQLKDKRALRELKTTRNNSKLPPPTKLTTSQVKPEHRELYLVEGDSAGGHAKYARLPHQEILKLKGKILNVLRDAKGKAFESDEVLNIMLSIGYDPNKKDPYDHLRVGRVILLTDPDPDGYHIASLVLALNVKYLRPLFERGMVFVCQAKEFTCEYKGVRYFGDSIEEIKKLLPKGANPPIQHIKGWGEVDASLLREVAFDPTKRKLIKLNPMSSEDVKKFTLLMSEDIEYRKKLLRIAV